MPSKHTTCPNTVDMKGDFSTFQTIGVSNTNAPRFLHSRNSRERITDDILRQQLLYTTMNKLQANHFNRRTPCTVNAVFSEGKTLLRIYES
jgi:hypothetical protein